MLPNPPPSLPPLHPPLYQAPGDLRLIDTEGPAASSGSAPQQLPPGCVTIPAGSLELISYTPVTAAAAAFNASQPSGGSPETGSGARQAVVLQMMGSSWSAPMAVPEPAAELGAAAAQAAAAARAQQQGKPGPSDKAAPAAR